MSARSSLFCMIITLLNDSERLLNKKWLCPIIRKSDASICWKGKQYTFLHVFYIVFFHISTQRNKHGHSKNRIVEHASGHTKNANISENDQFRKFELPIIRKNSCVLLH